MRRVAPPRRPGPVLRISAETHRHRRTGRHRDPGQAVGRPRADFCDSLEEHAEHAHLRGRVPGRQRQPATRRKDPCALGHRQLRAGEVWEPEVADHSIKGSVLERERLGVGAPELDVRMLRVCPGEHRLRDVHAPYRRSPTSRLRRHVPGPGGHVEHPRARTHSSNIQERLNQAARDIAEEPCVPLHPLFPGTRFKLIEGVEVDAHSWLTCACSPRRTSRRAYTRTGGAAMTSPREKRQRLFKQLLSMQSDTLGGCARSNDCRSMERNVGETGGRLGTSREPSRWALRALRASNPLLSRAFRDGARRARTADLLIANQALFQLSYSPSGSGLSRSS